MIHCSFLQREAQGLDRPPFDGPIGQEIFQRVSQEAWSQWLEMQTKIINEYRLDLSEPEAKRKLLAQMRAFLKLDEGSEKSDILKVGTPT